MKKCMKKSTLVWLTAVPILAGYLVNRMLFVPVIGMILYNIVPLFTLGFWFYLGSQYSRTDWRAVLAILMGSTTGIVSLALYIWQFLGQSDETRNTALAGFSQMYSAAVPGWLTVRLAALFETRPNYIGIATMTAMQVISLILMTAIFAVGYVWGKRHWPAEAESVSSIR